MFTAMDWKGFILVCFLLVFSKFLEKKFPHFCKRIELPCLILFTILATAYCCMLVYGVYDTLTSSVSTDDKVFFCIFIAVIVSIYAVMVVIEWKRWFTKRKKDSD